MLGSSGGDGLFVYRIGINKKRANFEDAFCGRMTNTTMNRRARYEITAGDFASPFTLLDLSFEFVGATAVTIEIMYANALLIYTVSAENTGQKLLWEKQTSFSTRQIGQIVTAYNSKTYRLQTILQYFLTFRKKYRQKNKMISTPCQYWILIVGLKTTSAASSSRCPQRRKWQPIHCEICAEWRAARHGFVTMTNAQ